MLSQAVNERVKALRPYLPQAMALAQQQVPGDFIRMRDGYAGLRYIGRVLYNTRDLQHVTYVPHEEVFMLLIDGIVGAAQYRIGKRRKSGMGV
jgi:hypothetical protein